jgi:transcriptional regulator with XRE-family HTH domain
MPYAVHMTIEAPTWQRTDRLIKARKLTGLTQSRFAAEINVHRNTVVNYENGREPQDDVLQRWATRAGVSFTWLRDGVGVSPSDEVIPLSPWSGSGRRASDSMVAA